MMQHHPVLKKYIRKISHCIPCSGEEKKQVIAHFQEDVLDYMEQNPNSTFADLQAQFGAPNEIARLYVSDQESSVLLGKMHTRKKVLGILAAVMAAFLLVWITAVTIDVYDAKKTNDGYLVVTCNVD